MTILWIIVSVAAFVLMLILLTIASRILGRGHLGNEQLSRDHYLDEVEAMSRFPYL
ncbi:MAG TPA: hypothetical protein VKU87_03360 [Thermomicrobiaceae bacterium]|nr:hypothetical protein [Thermomicrobiaceae bacterium]